MLCENCGQHNADIHLVRVVNGVCVEEDICKECAEKMMPLNDSGKVLKMSFSLEGIMDISDALKSLLFPMMPDIYANKGSDLKCPHCGQEITPEELFNMQSDQNEGEKDIVFDFSQPEVSDTVPDREAAHAVSPDLKTRIASNSAEQELSALARELTAAISEERYERAAEIRDRVEAIKKIMMGEEPKEE